MISSFSRVNSDLARHLYGRGVDRTSRQTSADWGSCPLLPGEQGQQMCAGMGLALEGSTDYPRLLAWGAMMGLEGTPLVQQRELLHLLGYVVPFKWRIPGSMAGTKPVSILPNLATCLLFHPFQLQSHPTLVRADGQRRQFMPVPVYGEGEGGWCDRLGAEANLVAAEGPGHCEGGFFAWLVEQSRGLVHAGVLEWASVLE